MPLTDYADLLAYLLAQPGTSHDTPYGPGVVVARVGKKIFCHIGVDDRPLTISIKCRPALALQYRAEYPAVQAGYHLNKQHWNTVLLDGSIPEAMVRQMVDHSYELVLAGLSKAERAEIGGGGEGGRLVEV